MTVVSGGQTGVDRAAFDAALELGLEIGGWVPKGRVAEDGVIPAKYVGLRETASSEPAERTILNVRDSDATLIVSRGALAGGTLLTFEAAMRLGRPVLHLDLTDKLDTGAASEVRMWLARVRPNIINVAGPRGSEDPTIGARSLAVLREALPHSD